MLKLLGISFAALVCAFALAGCDVGRSPTSHSNLSTELPGPFTGPAPGQRAADAAPEPVVTTWRCVAGGLFAAPGCARQGFHALSSAAATAPGAPGGLTSSVSGSTVHLAWTAPSGGDAVSSYLVEAGSASGLSDLASFDTGNAAVTLVVASVPAGSYFVRVRATNSAGPGAASNEVIVTVAGGACTTAPGAPANLAATVSGTSVSLSWTGATAGCTATGYVLEAGSASGLSDLANFNTGTTSTSFSASGIGSGTYFVRVRAANAGGSSAASNEVSFTIGSPTPTPCTSPSAPGALSAAASGTTVTLSWGAASGTPTSYVVEVGTSPGASNIASQDTGSTATSITSTLSPGTYFARVRATNACGTGAASAEATFTIAAPPCTVPSAPGGLAASVSGTTLTLSWTAASDSPTSYLVEIGTSSGGSNVAATDTGSTATTATTTLSAGTYFIRVKAVNACGTGSASNEVTATTTSATPAVVTITSSGVSPKNLTVSPGTRVLFVNNSQINHDMTSNPHPEHTDCQEINQVGFLVPGQSKETGNLNTVRTCGYHDHNNSLDTTMQGTITIR